jgi:DNA-binding IscR family transcriptional regulator
MQISTRFTIAIHMLVAMEYFKDDYKVTGDFLAGSVNVNPVVIRRIVQQLKDADIVTVRRGEGGISVARPLDEITLLDVFNAVESVDDGNLFHIHENPNTQCPVGRNIHKVLSPELDRFQKGLEESLSGRTVADMVIETENMILSESADSGHDS